MFVHNGIVYGVSSSPAKTRQHRCGCAWIETGEQIAFCPMHSDMRVIQCTTRGGMHARFKQLDPFHKPNTVDPRSDPVFIERRAKEMAREYAAKSPPLLHWVQQGNKLPEIYR